MYSLRRAIYACSKLAQTKQPIPVLSRLSPAQPGLKLCCIKKEIHNIGLTFAVL